MSRHKTIWVVYRTQPNGDTGQAILYMATDSQQAAQVMADSINEDLRANNVWPEARIGRVPLFAVEEE